MFKRTGILDFGPPGAGAMRRAAWSWLRAGSLGASVCMGALVCAVWASQGAGPLTGGKNLFRAGFDVHAGYRLFDLADGGAMRALPGQEQRFMRPKREQSNRHHPGLETLEPRLMMSADVGGVALWPGMDNPAPALPQPVHSWSGPSSLATAESTQEALEPSPDAPQLAGLLNTQRYGDSVFVATPDRPTHIVIAQDEGIQTVAVDRVESYGVWFTWKGTSSVASVHGVKDGLIGAGVLTNLPEAYVAYPQIPRVGETIELRGVNLESNGIAKAFLDNGVETIELNLTHTGENAVQLAVPALGVEPGEYTLHYHNGSGGDIGWARPLAITITEAQTELVFATPWSQMEGESDDAILGYIINAVEQADENVAVVTVDENITLSQFILDTADGVRFVGVNNPTITINKIEGNSVTNAVTLLGGSWVEFHDVQISTNLENVFKLHDGRGLKLDGVVIDHTFRDDAVVIELSASDARTEHAVEIANSDISFTQYGINTFQRIGGTNGFYVHDTVWTGHLTGDGTNTNGSVIDLKGGRAIFEDNIVSGHDKLHGDILNRYFIQHRSGAGYNGTGFWLSGDQISEVGAYHNEVEGTGTHPNQGEAILFHEQKAFGQQRTTMDAGADTITVNAAHDAEEAADATGEFVVYVKTGRGMGQFRRIIGVDGATYALDQAWNIAPEAGDVVAISRMTSNIGIVNESIDALPYALDIEGVDSKTQGIFLFHGAFNGYIANNTIANVVNGVMLEDAEDQPIGWMDVRDNTVTGVHEIDVPGWVELEKKNVASAAAVISNRILSGGQVTGASTMGVRLTGLSSDSDGHLVYLGWRRPYSKQDVPMTTDTGIIGTTIQDAAQADHATELFRVDGLVNGLMWIEPAGEAGATSSSSSTDTLLRYGDVDFDGDVDQDDISRIIMAGKFGVGQSNATWWEGDFDGDRDVDNDDIFLMLSGGVYQPTAETYAATAASTETSTTDATSVSDAGATVDATAPASTTSSETDSPAVDDVTTSTSEDGGLVDSTAVDASLTTTTDSAGTAEASASEPVVEPVVEDAASAVDSGDATTVDAGEMIDATPLSDAPAAPVESDVQASDAPVSDAQPADETVSTTSATLETTAPVADEPITTPTTTTTTTTATTTVTEPVTSDPVSADVPDAVEPVTTTDAAPALPGDADSDGDLDAADVVQVLNAGRFGTGEAATWAEGDFNGDGLVTNDDIFILLASGLFNPDSQRAIIEASQSTMDGLADEGTGSSIDPMLDQSGENDLLAA